MINTGTLYVCIHCKESAFTHPRNIIHKTRLNGAAYDCEAWIAFLKMHCPNKEDKTLS